MPDSFLKYLLATLILVVAVEGLANAQNSDPITAVRIEVVLTRPVLTLSLMNRHLTQ